MRHVVHAVHSYESSVSHAVCSSHVVQHMRQLRQCAVTPEGALEVYVEPDPDILDRRFPQLRVPQLVGVLCSALCLKSNSRCTSCRNPWPNSFDARQGHA
jgi:hypothetical protein